MEGNREVSNFGTCLKIPSHNTFEGTNEVLDQTPINNTLLIKEALHICFTDSELINRDEDIIIPECWQLILNAIIIASSTHMMSRQETDKGTLDSTERVRFLLVTSILY